MIENLKKGKFGLVGEIDFPLFDRKINVMVADDKTIDYAERCAEYLARISNEMTSRIKKYVYRYFREFSEYMLENDIQVDVPLNVLESDIFDYVTPELLIVNKPANLNSIGFHIEFSCEWEHEHGLEVTIKDDKILYVGSFDDMPAWNEQRINSAGFYDSTINSNVNFADRE